MVDIFLDGNQISVALKIQKRDIPYYVKEYGMPAFKEKDNGTWKAMKKDLYHWAVEYKGRFLECK